MRKCQARNRRMVHPTGLARFATCRLPRSGSNKMRSPPGPPNTKDQKRSPLYLAQDAVWDETCSSGLSLTTGKIQEELLAEQGKSNFEQGASSQDLTHRLA